MILIIGWLGLFQSAESLQGQNIFWRDSINIGRLKNPSIASESMFRWRMVNEAEYTISFSDFLQVNHLNQKSSNQISLLQNLKLVSVIEQQEKFRLSNSFLHTLGIQIFLDSITRFQSDENVLDTRFELKINKNFSASLSSLITTRLFNEYNYWINDSGIYIRTLNASFLTPLVWTFSFGFSWNFKEIIGLNFGLNSARFTYIRDKSVYTNGNISSFYGVPRDKLFLFEYGLSLRLQVDKVFNKRIIWKCEILLFKDYQNPPDLSFKNDLDIIITRFFKTRIQTHIFYNESGSNRLQLENLISCGFNFHL